MGNSRKSSSTPPGRRSNRTTGRGVVADATVEPTQVRLPSYSVYENSGGVGIESPTSLRILSLPIHTSSMISPTCTRRCTSAAGAPAFGNEHQTTVGAPTFPNRCWKPSRTTPTCRPVYTLLPLFFRGLLSGLLSPVDHSSGPPWRSRGPIRGSLILLALPFRLPKFSFLTTDRRTTHSSSLRTIHPPPQPLLAVSPDWFTRGLFHLRLLLFWLCDHQWHKTAWGSHRSLPNGLSQNGYGG